MAGVRHVLDVAGLPARPDADAIVLVAQILDALEVEGLDGALLAQVVLGAARGRLDHGLVAAVDLGDPEAELVRLAVRRRREMQIEYKRGSYSVGTMAKKKYGDQYKCKQNRYSRLQKVL